MAVSGNWIGHFSWGATENYGQFNITFNANGTFSGAFNGHWHQQHGTLLMSFNTGPAKYGITLCGNVGTGAITTFAGLNGAAYLTKEGTVGIAELRRRGAPADPRRRRKCRLSGIGNVVAGFPIKMLFLKGP